MYALNGDWKNRVHFVEFAMVCTETVKPTLYLSEVYQIDFLPVYNTKYSHRRENKAPVDSRSLLQLSCVVKGLKSPGSIPY